MRCVKIEPLVDFAQGRAEGARADLIQAHLTSGCVRCQENLDWVRKLIRLTATDESVEPPRWVLERAVSLFQTHGPQRKPDLWQRLVASLVFDSLAPPQPVGIRQAKPTARQYLYRAGEWDLDLSLEAGAELETIDITGQLLKRDEPAEAVAGNPVHLVQSGEILTSTVVDRLGEFTFDHIASGFYGLRIDLPDQQLWIDRVYVNLSN